MDNAIFYLLFVSLGMLVSTKVSAASKPTGNTRIVYLEAAPTVAKDHYEIYSLFQLPRSTRQFSIQEVVFQEYGASLGGSYGLSKDVSVALELGWLKQLDNGHSGQFDLATRLKYRIFKIGELFHGAIAGEFGANKKMGFSPWYSTKALLPATWDRHDMTISVAPAIQRGLDSTSEFAFSIESGLSMKVLNSFGFWVESTFISRDANPKFAEFFRSKGLTYWGGLLWNPIEPLQTQMVLFSKAPRDNLTLGFIGILLNFRGKSL